MSVKKLSHLGAKGEAQMVDVSAKPVTSREARARGVVRMSAPAFEAIMLGNLPKGEVVATARIAGIQAAKRASDLIPMCHPLILTLIEVECVPDRRLPGIRIEARDRGRGGGIDGGRHGQERRPLDDHRRGRAHREARGKERRASAAR